MSSEGPRQNDVCADDAADKTIDLCHQVVRSVVEKQQLQAMSRQRLFWAGHHYLPCAPPHLLPGQLAWWLASNYIIRKKSGMAIWCKIRHVTKHLLSLTSIIFRFLSFLHFFLHTFLPFPFLSVFLWHFLYSFFFCPVQFFTILSCSIYVQYTLLCFGRMLQITLTSSEQWTVNTLEANQLRLNRNIHPPCCGDCLAMWASTTRFHFSSLVETSSPPSSHNSRNVFISPSCITWLWKIFIDIGGQIKGLVAASRARVDFQATLVKDMNIVHLCEQVSAPCPRCILKP